MAELRPLLLYLHGFNSSPQSHKAQIMVQYLADNRPDIELILPQLPAYPEQAWQLLIDILEPYFLQDDSRPLGIVGSSLGGFFATKLAQEYHCKAVLINPAVKPYELLLEYLGAGENPYSGEPFFLSQQHVLELKDLDVPVVKPELFWTLLQTGDEVLDYVQALARYQQTQVTLEQGGDHSFIDFERYPPQIIEFLKL